MKFRLMDPSQTSERAAKRLKMETEEEEDVSMTDSSSEEVDLQPDISEEDMKSLMECEKKLKTNPNLYDTHVQYLTLLKTAGLKQKLQNARKAFKERFPLSEKLWIEWIDDETDASLLAHLFAMAMEDYVSIALWKRRLEFLSHQITSGDADALDTWREVSEQAMDICGMHFSEGHEIWMLIVDAENRILENLTSRPEEEDQEERIRQLYFTALQCPLLHLDTLLESYAEWERGRGSMSTDPPPNVQSSIETARVGIDTRRKFEEALSTEDLTERLAAFVAFCAMEERYGTLHQVQSIYERALAAFPVTHTLWLQYGSYIEEKAKSLDKILQIYTRATRNCPWLGQLWERMIRASALYEREPPDVREIYDQALQAGLRSEEDYMVVILAWLDFLRVTYWKHETEGREEQRVSFDQLHNAFAFASSLMKSYFPKYVDQQHRIVRYWTDALITIAQDIDQARSIWEDVLQQSKTAPQCYETWMYYIRMETTEKCHGPARKLYSRAFQAVTDPDVKYTLAQEWLRHEGTTGSPRQYANAVSHTKSFVQEYTASLAAKQDPQLAAASKKKAESVPKVSESDVKDLRRIKAKPARPKKRVDGQEHRPTRQLPDIKPKQDQPRPDYDDKNTLFVTRIPIGTEDDQIRHVFDGCGEITALRHLRFFNGVTRGRAYVVFSNEEGMLAGLRKNTTVLNGSQLLIQISKPTRIRQEPHFQVEHQSEAATASAVPTEPPSSPTRPLTNDDFRKLLR